MPFRRRARAPARRRRAAVPRKTQRIRKLAGQRPVTWAETISRYGGAVGRLAQSVSTIAGLVNSETKFIDVAVNGTGISNSGSYSQFLNSVAEGDDYTQRNGRVILDKNLVLKMRIRADSTQTSGTAFGWAIVMDKKCETLGATPWTEVFATTDPQSPISKVNSERFVVIKRGFISMSPAGSSLIQARNVFVNLKGIHTKYDGTASTDFDQNSLILVAISDQATLVPSLFVQSRFNFHDN